MLAQPCNSRWLNLLAVAKDRGNSLIRHRSRYGYIGGQGGGNLGDEAMYEVAQRLVSPARLVSIGFPGQERRLAKIGLSGGRYFDSVILGGGTLINSYIWKDEVDVLLRHGARMWTLGTGAGSCGFEHPVGVNLSGWAPLLNRFMGIGVRGPLSRQTLESAGIQGAEVVGDLALWLAQDQVAPLVDPPRVALNVATSASGAEEFSAEVFKEVQAVILELIAAGWRVVPIAMHLTDVAPLKNLLREVGITESEPPIITTAADFFERVRLCRLTVAIRLHASILSCCCGVPPLMLGYRDKCRDFMESMNLGQWHVDLQHFTSGEIIARARELVHCSAGLRPVILECAQGYRRRLTDYVRRMTRERECGGASSPEKS